MNQLYKNVLLWSVILLMFVAFYQFFNCPPVHPSDMPYSDFAADAKAGKISVVQFRGQSYLGQLRDGKEFETTGPMTPPDDLLHELDSHNVTYRFLPGSPAWDRIGFAILIATLIILNALILVEHRRKASGYPDKPS